MLKHTKSIAIITTVHSPLDGRIFYKQAVSLKNAGYGVTLYAPNLDRDSVLKIADKKGIEYIPLPYEFMFRNRIPAWWELFNLLRQRSFDFYHFHDPELLPLCILFKFIFAKKTKLVYDVHEEYVNDISHKSWLPLPVRIVGKFAIDRIEKWGASHCSLLVSATKKIEERNSKIASKSILVRNYPLFFKQDIISQSLGNRLPLKKKSTVRLIYVGGIGPTRGIEETIIALEYLNDLDIEFHLLGRVFPENFRDKIKSFADANVFIHPPVEFSDVPSYLFECDIGIVCLAPIPGIIEALPVKLFEYMQAGVPVVASNFSLWEEIVIGSNCGVVVEPQNPKSIANGIRKLVTNPSLLEQMGISAKLAIEQKYSWQQESEQLIEAYAQLIDC